METAHVKIKEKYQVTVPARLRKALGLRIGDVLKAEVRVNRLVLRPQVMVDKAQAFTRFQAALRDVHTHNKDIGDDAVAQDALKAIAEYRKEKHARALRRA